MEKNANPGRFEREGQFDSKCVIKKKTGDNFPCFKKLMKVEILQLKSPNSGRQSAKKLADFKRRKCKSYANEEFFF